MEDVMGYALKPSEPTHAGGWQVVLLNDGGKCCGTLLCTCASEEEAHRYAKAFLRLFGS
jgi:hypothetical protein